MLKAPAPFAKTINAPPAMERFLRKFTIWICCPFAGANQKLWNTSVTGTRKTSRATAAQRALNPRTTPMPPTNSRTVATDVAALKRSPAFRIRTDQWMLPGRPDARSTGNLRPVLPQPVEQRSAAQAEAPGGLGLIAAGCRHRAADQGAFHRFEVFAEIDCSIRRLFAVHGCGLSHLASEPALIDQDVRAARCDRPALDDVLELADVSRPGVGPHHLQRLVVQADRKSTRLNSSHDQISYAVFSLKKKKKKNHDLFIKKKKKKKKKQTKQKKKN